MLNYRNIMGITATWNLDPPKSKTGKNIPVTFKTKSHCTDGWGERLATPVIATCEIAEEQMKPELKLTIFDKALSKLRTMVQGILTIPQAGVTVRAQAFCFLLLAL